MTNRSVSPVQPFFPFWSQHFYVKSQNTSVEHESGQALALVPALGPGQHGKFLDSTRSHFTCHKQGRVMQPFWGLCHMLQEPDPESGQGPWSQLTHRGYLPCLASISKAPRLSFWHMQQISCIVTSEPHKEEKRKMLAFWQKVQAKERERDT